MLWNFPLFAAFSYIILLIKVIFPHLFNKCTQVHERKGLIRPQSKAGPIGCVEFLNVALSNLITCFIFRSLGSDPEICDPTRA